MNSILLRTLPPNRNSSLLTFSEYREAEQARAKLSIHDAAPALGRSNSSGLPGSSGSSHAGTSPLLEYETLELRIHPTCVTIDNDT